MASPTCLRAYQPTMDSFVSSTRWPWGQAWGAADLILHESPSQEAPVSIYLVASLRPLESTTQLASQRTHQNGILGDSRAQLEQILIHGVSILCGYGQSS